MSSVLVAGFLANGTIDDTTRQAVTAAAELGGKVILGLVGTDPAAAAASDGIAAVAEVIGVPLPQGVSTLESDHAAVRAMIDDLKPRAIVMGATARASAFAAALAEAMDLGFASNVVHLASESDGSITATRSLYGGKVHADVGLAADAPALVVTRPGVWNAAEASVPLPCRLIPFPASTPRIRHVSFISQSDSGFDLTRHEVILCVGRGVGSKDGIAVFSEIAGKLGAALAGSRPIVDAGWLPRDRQVGQSGSSVAPRVYLAFGVSGALQHVVGIRGAKSVIAVNSDKEAPIFGVAKHGAVADMFEVAKELQKRLG